MAIVVGGYGASDAANVKVVFGVGIHSQTVSIGVREDVACGRVALGIDRDLESTGRDLGILAHSDLRFGNDVDGGVGFGDLDGSATV